MKPDPLKAISVPQEPVSAVRDALCSFSGVCGIYPHRDGTVPVMFAYIVRAFS